MQRKDGTIVDRREMLRIKLKSLATESKYIRREEDKLRPADSTLRCELRGHRTREVRFEARATSLAYGWIKGYKRSQIETKWHDLPEHINKELIKKVEAMIKRYGPGGTVTGPIAQWWSERL